MNYAKYSGFLFVLFALCGLAGCSNDEQTFSVYAQDQAVGKSLSISGTATQVELKFNISSEEITNVTVGLDDAQTEWVDNSLIIRLPVNDTDNARTIPVTITSIRNTKTFNIIQAVKTQVTSVYPYYSFPAEGGSGTIELDLSEKMDCNCTMVYDGEMFASIDQTQQSGNRLTITLSIAANSQFGRACGLRIRPTGGDELLIGIWQQPREFTNNEDISVEKSGALGVMLGSNMQNIARLRHVSLSGQLNGNDLAVLKKITSKSSYTGITYPTLDLDLKWVSIVSDPQCKGYYERFGNLGAIGGNDRVFTVEKQIPERLFSSSDIIGSIVLPASVNTIGNGALQYCANLRSVTLPIDCKRIGAYAFFNCANLTHIESKFADDHCRLTAIGDYAFSGIGHLDTLILPEELSELTSTSLLGFQVDKIYALWPTPPAISIYGIVQNCTLYVPQNCAESYRASEQWTKFTDIRELNGNNLP